MEKPRLLLLDEPTNGLDPAGIIDLRGLIRELAKNEAAIFMASHLLTEVEQVCDRVLLVRSGQVIKELDQRRVEASKLKLVVSSEADLAPLLEWARRTRVRVNPADRSPLVVTLGVNRPTPQIVRELVVAGVNIEEVRKEHRTLEQEFIDLLGTSIQ
jgi:ABC-2 type transport system ATP-binding protein